MSTLVRAEPRDDHDPEGLRARVSGLETLLDERGAELDRVKAELGAFKARYQRQVGTLHDQLDALELAIAEAELGELASRLEDRAADASAPPRDVQPAPPRFTSDAVRRLFRDVAKAIHPDLADDDDTRHRRHALMIEANRAYAVGDEEQLRWLLQAWASSPEAVTGSDAEALRQRLVRRAAQIDQQLDRLAGDLAALKESPSWRLKAMVDEAAAKGKDLVADMVTRLKRDIMVATNRLDALRPPT